MSATEPLVKHMFTADPRAHVYEGRIYVYPSHDVDFGIPENDFGDHFAMRDYHVFSMDRVGADVVDHGKVLDVADVPWAERQMWSNDCGHKDGKYYMYFPAKDAKGVFRIGVAVSDSPGGPFVPEPEPMAGSFSIDTAFFDDGDAQYLYFGGIWGGQLQRWTTGEYNPDAPEEPTEAEPAIGPRVARLSDDMLSFAETPREILILDENGDPILQTDKERRFFEAPWMHTYKGKYYLSYSTGDSHLIVYATGDNPYGPFTYQGVVLTPVLGWTTHHSIIEHEGKWWLFYHDSSLSGGRTPLRSMKVTELKYRPDGSIATIDGSL